LSLFLEGQGEDGE